VAQSLPKPAVIVKVELSAGSVFGDHAVLVGNHDKHTLRLPLHSQAERVIRRLVTPDRSRPVVARYTFTISARRRATTSSGIGGSAWTPPVCAHVRRVPTSRPFDNDGCRQGSLDRLTHLRSFALISPGSRSSRPVL
jgi:hypothetical protein